MRSGQSNGDLPNFHIHSCRDRCLGSFDICFIMCLLLLQQGNEGESYCHVCHHFHCDECHNQMKQCPSCHHRHESDKYGHTSYQCNYVLQTRGGREPVTRQIPYTEEYQENMKMSRFHGRNKSLKSKKMSHMKKLKLLTSHTLGKCPSQNHVKFHMNTWSKIMWFQVAPISVIGNHILKPVTKPNLKRRIKPFMITQLKRKKSPNTRSKQFLERSRLLTKPNVN